MLDDAPLALALAAGLVAAVNPCGFALLPAYLTLLVAGEPGGGDAPSAGRAPAVGRALALTGAMTLGFVAVFGGFGLLAAPAADAVARRLPWLGIVLGVVLLGLGAWLLAGRSLPSLPGLSRGPAVTRRFGSMALFGAAYAVASLGCTIGPFLAVVVAAGFRGGSPLAGLVLFLTYAAGMGLMVGAVALAVALARDSLLRRLRRAAPALARAGGLLLVLAGGYVAWYGWYELRLFAGGSAADPVVDGAATLQRAVAGGVDAAGAGGVAAAAGLLVTAAAVAALLARRRSTRADPTALLPPDHGAPDGEGPDRAGGPHHAGPPGEGELSVR
jgi:cytochrome c biogenesis protein CcdA